MKQSMRSTHTCRPERRLGARVVGKITDVVHAAIANHGSAVGKGAKGMTACLLISNAQSRRDSTMTPGRISNISPTTQRERGKLAAKPEGLTRVQAKIFRSCRGAGIWEMQRETVCGSCRVFHNGKREP